jgi:hypothetical protein
MPKIILSSPLKTRICNEISNADRSAPINLVLPYLSYCDVTTNPIMCADAVSTFLVQQGIIERGVLTFELNFETLELCLHFPLNLHDDPPDDLV